jgi:hypothetical protein
VTEILFLTQNSPESILTGRELLLAITKQSIKDDVFAKQKDMKTKSIKLGALLAAITRNEG